MEYYLNLFSGRQFVDSNGAPYNGAKLFIYSAGSSTKVTTYKDNAGASSHANPIILNARGEPADGAGASQPIWQEAGVDVKLVLAPANDTDPPVSAISTWDNIGGINDASAVNNQWIVGPTPTFVSTTGFTLVGDQSTTFHVGRRVKTTNSGGTIYSTITAVAYTTLTTVTVVNDSGVLDSGISAVSYAVLSADGASAPSVKVSGLDWTHQGQVTMSGKSIWMAEGAAVASANDCNIWTTDGNTVHVTGTTEIQDWGTAPQAGAWKWVIFDSTPQLTYHATTNKLNTNSANYTAVAGDRALVYAESTSSYLVTIYPVNVNPYTLSGVSIALAAPGTSDGSAASTAFVQQATGTAQSVGVGVQKFGAIDIPATSTLYLCALGQAANGASETYSACFVNDAVTCSTLYARVSAAITTGTVTITVRKNGVDQAVTCQLSSSAQQNSDLSNSFDLSPGEYFSIKAVTSGLDTATKDLTVSLVFKYKGTNIGASFIPLNNINGTAFGRIGEPTNSASSLAAGHELMLPSCVTGGLASYDSANNLKLVETATAKRTATGSTASTAQSFINRNEFIHNTTTYYYISSTAASYGCWSFRSPYASGLPAPGIMAFLSVNQTQNTTCFMQGWASQTPTTSEGNVSLPVPAGKARKLRGRASNALPVGQSTVITLRKNGVDTALTVTLNSSNQYAFDLSNSVTFAAGDLLSIKAVSSATTGTINYTAVIEFDDENAA